MVCFGSAHVSAVELLKESAELVPGLCVHSCRAAFFRREVPSFFVTDGGEPVTAGAVTEMLSQSNI